MTHSEEKDFPAQIATQVGQLVKRARSESGLSAQKLAEECTRLGVQMTRNMVASLENNRRSSVSVPEVLAISTVLKVPPITLLFPLTSRPFEDCLGRPETEATAVDFYDWFTGADEGYFSGDFAGTGKLEFAGRAQWELLDTLSAFRRDASASSRLLLMVGEKLNGSADDPEDVLSLGVVLDGLGRQVESAAIRYDRLVDAGLTIPPLLSIAPYRFLENYLPLVEAKGGALVLDRVEQIRNALKMKGGRS